MYNIYLKRNGKHYGWKKTYKTYTGALKALAKIEIIYQCKGCVIGKEN